MDCTACCCRCAARRKGIRRRCSACSAPPGQAASCSAACSRRPSSSAPAMCAPSVALRPSLAIIALLTGILVDPIWWVVLRAFTGFSTAGTSMIIESWLNERATNESRGAIFSLYIAITLMGVVGGQLMIPFGDTSTTLFFMCCRHRLLPGHAADAPVDCRLASTAEAGQPRPARRSIETRRSPFSASCSSASPTALMVRLAPSSAVRWDLPTATSR